jgi:hypothetical protein
MITVSTRSDVDDPVTEQVLRTSHADVALGRVREFLEESTPGAAAATRR